MIKTGKEVCNKIKHSEFNEEIDELRNMKIPYNGDLIWNKIGESAYECSYLNSCIVILNILPVNQYKYAQFTLSLVAPFYLPLSFLFSLNYYRKSRFPSQLFLKDQSSKYFRKEKKLHLAEIVKKIVNKKKKMLELFLIITFFLVHLTLQEKKEKRVVTKYDIQKSIGV